MDFFKIKERGSDVRTEIFAGLTTFFAMCYIVVVNPNQVAAGGAAGWLVAEGADAAAISQIWNAVYIASILVACIGTLLMALYAKMPFAQACGMGLNSFFCTSFVSGAFFAGVDVIEGYQSGVVIIFLSGVIFLILSFTGLRKYIATAMPECLKKAISAGIGLFIAYIGFQNVGLIQSNQYTISQLFDFHGAIVNAESGFAAWLAMAPVVLTIIGLILIAVLEKKNVKGSVIITILIVTVLYYVSTLQVPSFDLGNIGQSFKDFASVGITGVFKPESWANAFGGAHIDGVFGAVVLIITFALVDMFDTVGTLYGTAAQADMLDENGDPINVDKSMMCDSIGTLTGAVLGTSTCTTFVESAAGVGAGGRTGLTSVVTAACFAACLFLSPIATIIPSCATAPALIYVGVLMMKGFGKIDMDDVASAVPAFLTVIMMCLSYSISNGIGVGAIAYVLIKVLTGKYSKKDLVVTIIALLFAARFLLITM
ncbi:MAG: NCS2 family permease [Tyzzerella sp.]|nr:NCS2 family permease [Tyzzerella sp.]